MGGQKEYSLITTPGTRELLKFRTTQILFIVRYFLVTGFLTRIKIRYVYALPVHIIASIDKVITRLSEYFRMR